MPRVSVLIVNYNAGPHLAACLAALCAQTMADFEAIVVDNGSADGSLEQGRAVVAGDERFRFDAAGANLGFAAANNRAAAQAAAPWLATLNPDAFAAIDWLDELLAAAANHPEAVMLGSLQVDAADPWRLDGAGDRYWAAGLAWRGGYGWPAAAAPAEDIEVFAPCAAAALYRADAFRTAGGFDETFFCYVEDVDLGFRMRLLGHHAVQAARARVRHVGGGSGGGGAASPFARYHGTRNMLWCFAKNMPAALFWPILPVHLMILLLLWLRAVPRGLGSAVGRGLIDGLAGLPALWSRRRAVQARRAIPLTAVIAALDWNPLSYLRRAPAEPRRG